MSASSSFQRRGLSVDRTVYSPCPFLSVFGDRYRATDQRNGDGSIIRTEDLYLDYVAYVAARTDDANLVSLSRRPRAFARQFLVVAIERGFTRVCVGGRRGYRVRRVGVGRNSGGGDVVALARPHAVLRGHATRRSVLERERREDPNSLPFVAVVNREIGKGVFASHDYKGGEDICEYLGQLISREEMQLRLPGYDALGLIYRGSN